METSDGSFAQFSVPFPQHGADDQREVSISFPANTESQSQWTSTSFDGSAFAGPQEWNFSFQQPYQPNGNAFRTPRIPQGASGPCLDLGGSIEGPSIADLEAADNFDVQSLVKPAGEQPALFARGNDLFNGYQPDVSTNVYTRSARATGVMTEPIQHDEASSATMDLDSGFFSLGRFNDVAPYAQNTNQDACSDYSAMSGAQPTSRATRPPAGRFRSDSQVVGNSRRTRLSQPLPVCQYCLKYWPKNRSDQTKHERKHTKPFKCRHADCIAKDVGFATENDLDRHYKSGRHREAPTKGALKGFICVACTDGKRKWWPRQDNFKAHCKRRHQNGDIELIMKMSAHDTRPSNTYSADENNTRVSDVAYQQSFPQQQDFNTFDIAQPEQATDLLSPMSFQLLHGTIPPTMQNIPWDMQQYGS